MTLILDLSFWLIETDGSLQDGEAVEYKQGLSIPVHRVHDERLGIDVMRLDY